MNMFRHGPENGFGSSGPSDLELNLLPLYMKYFSALCSFLF